MWADTEISEKRNFFVNRSITKDFQREIFLGQVATESLHTQDSNLYERGVQQILTLFWSAQVGRGRQNAIRLQKYEVSQKIDTATIFKVSVLN